MVGPDGVDTATRPHLADHSRPVEARLREMRFGYRDRNCVRAATVDVTAI